MQRRRNRFTDAILEWFGVDSDFERVPADPRAAYRHDVVLGGMLAVAALLGTELARSVGYFDDTDHPVWLLYLLTVVGVLPLTVRRRYPLAVVAVVYLHFLVVGFTIPMITMTSVLQVVYFITLFTAVAWARDRRAMLLVVSMAVLAMFAWIIWQFAVGIGVQGIIDQMGLTNSRPGVFSPAVAMVAQTWLVNLAYFLGAIVAGQLMWHAARRRAQLTEQATTIERQAAELQQQAVITERLRIARELHDVVAHHVSVIGIHASAARRLLANNPDAAADPLATIESASRDAVEQMRGLVGTLRETAPATDLPDEAATDRRQPEPGLADIAHLVNTDGGLDVDLTLVEEPTGAAHEVPAPVGLSLYRTVQEGLANVRKHSTARHASVTVRVDWRYASPGTPGAERFPHGYAEVEVLDDGRPRPGSSGTGLGLVGLRERVATHSGVAEIGPRVTGGYRVRVRLPLPEEAQ